MTLCRFYQTGTCRYGNSCKFEHPGANNNAGNDSNNRFSAFGSSSNANNGPDTDDNPYKLSRDAIEKDLTSETPQWILSAYGPGTNAPEQLWGGFPLEQSADEIRLYYLTSEQAGKQGEALEQIAKLYQEAQGRIRNAASNLDDVIRYINSSRDKHPNRVDIVAQGNSNSTSTSAPSLGSSSNNPFVSATTGSNASQNSAMLGGSSSVFGQPSNLGQNPSPFGQSSTFGEPSQPNGGSTFGQPSSLGGGGAFGKPSAFGAAGSNNTGTGGFGALNSSGPAFGQSGFGSSAGNTAAATGTAFGQPSTFGQKPAFGAPSFGKPGFGQPAFGAPAAPAASGGGIFGQASKPTQTSSGFGQTTQTSGSAFGQPSSLGQSGGSAFGQPSQLGQSGGSAFGQTSKLGQSNGSSFGQSSQLGGGSSAFGQPSQIGAKLSAFGSSPAPTGGSTSGSGFGAFASKSGSGGSPFGQPSGNNANAATNSPFGGGGSTSTGSPFGQASASTSNPFGSTSSNSSAFGQAAPVKPNPFGAPANSANGSAFGQPSNLGANSSFSTANSSNGNTASSTSGFGQASSAPANPFGVPPAPAAPAKTNDPYPPNSGKQHPPVEMYTTRNSQTQQLAIFKGRPVEYVSDVPGIRDSGSGVWRKILFPNGPPINYPATEISLDKMEATVKQQWEHFATSGSFAGGKIPMQPPPRVACTWDF
ncbi:hypothetical protein Cpir12675_001498 [Ceratocystis pirilliformis]|uniref:C3H1-type domain-containing protein n=1 Tax=Ceratocystis pirilliformis TaxID=259994 RepID=A0ABR3ZF30_9PEZI